MAPGQRHQVILSMRHRYCAEKTLPVEGRRILVCLFRIPNNGTHSPALNKASEINQTSCHGAPAGYKAIESGHIYHPTGNQFKTCSCLTSYCNNQQRDPTSPNNHFHNKICTGRIKVRLTNVHDYRAVFHYVISKPQRLAVNLSRLFGYTSYNPSSCRALPQTIFNIWTGNLQHICSIAVE